MAELSIFLKVLLNSIIAQQLNFVCSGGTEKRELVRLTEGGSLLGYDAQHTAANCQLCVFY
jgi:hypothetical protein